MRLRWDKYTCEKCGHFNQDISLHDIVERDDPSFLSECHCTYCASQRK